MNQIPTIEVKNYVFDVITVLNELKGQTIDRGNLEVIVTGEGAHEVAASVVKVFKDWKCDVSSNELEDGKGVYIIVFE